MMTMEKSQLTQGIPSDTVDTLATHLLLLPTSDTSIRVHLHLYTTSACLY